MDRDAVAGVNGAGHGGAHGAPIWAKAMVSADDFASEQQALGKVWTFLGYASEIPDTNDWFRTRLGGRSIFVQRFREGIRAFENRCAHRFYPLRTKDKGNGPVVCGYHHWRYNEDGLALGVPMCVENFGKTPRELDARLAEVELGFCGPMIFGRFPGGRAVSLEEWLGPGWHILSYLAAKPCKKIRIDKTVESHWKPILEISLDDYHVVAIHPTTFGKEGYVPIGRIRYFQFGAHSAYCPGADADYLARMVAECERGEYKAHRYRIFQFFPNLMVVLLNTFSLAGESHWYVLVQNLTPEGPGRTALTRRYFPMPLPKGVGLLKQALRIYLRPWLNIGAWYYIRKIQGEDDAACEKLQTIAGQIDGEPRLARQEVRVAWWDEEYRRALGDPTLPAQPPAFETFGGKDL
jgi:phenylpropionate dioxygenase-like ring-hydroxylating dioxygenase large terminal subunit